MKSSDPLNKLSKRPDAVSAMVVVLHVGFVFFPVYFAAAVGPGLWLLPLYFWFGLSMNGLLNLMHEASHYHVFRARRANDFFGRRLLGPLAVADFDGYRQRHWDHHRRLGEPDDPKLTYHSNIQGRHGFLMLLRCLTLVEAARKFLRQTHDDEPAPGRSSHWLLSLLVVQAIFVLSLFGTAWITSARDVKSSLVSTIIAYGFVYVYGLGSLTVFAANLRAIAEHQIGEDDADSVGAAALRNLSCNPVTRLCFGAYGFGEHATHHQQPAIPYYNLPAATAELAAKNPRMAPSHGYLATILRLVRRKEPSPSVFSEGVTS